MTAARKPVNSFDLGFPFVVARNDSGGFDTKQTKDGRHAYWTAYLGQTADGYTMVHLADVEHVQEWARKQGGGLRRDRFGGWRPDPTGTDIPCGRSICRPLGRSTQFSVCDNRRKPGQDACGVHLAADRRQVERHRAYEEARERSEAANRIAQDAVEALKAHDVEGHVHYDWRAGRFTGRVTVHAEDMLALLRELDDLRPLRDL